MAEVLTEFLGTDRIDLDVHGFDASGAAGNLAAVRHFDTAARYCERRSSMRGSGEDCTTADRVKPASTWAARWPTTT